MAAIHQVQREQVFKKSKEEVKQIAIDGAKLLNKLASETEGNFSFEYSPESFPGTEVDYAVEASLFKSFAPSMAICFTSSLLFLNTCSRCATEVEL